MSTKFSKFWKLLFLAAPMVLALIGFYMDPPADILELSPPAAFAHSVFLGLTMYIIDYSDVPANIWLELARWTAPLATASGILLFINTLREQLRNQLLRMQGRATAVYGPEEEKELILPQLGSQGIDGKDHFVRAQRYILLGDEQENLDFYNNHREALQDSTVYLKCRSLQNQSSSDPKLRLFDLEETAARLFWKEHCFYGGSVACGHKMKLVFLGFGRLGQELLITALQNNLFDPGQRIEYHIFGQDEGFTSIYHQLSAISDPVIFHSEPWYEQLELLLQSQAVLVLDQEEQLALLRNLQMALNGSMIYVFPAALSGARLLAQKDPRILLFDWKQKAQSLENILGMQLYRRAKRLNLRYAHLYQGIAETEENQEQAWNQLDTFTRYSNVSAADYFEIVQKILEFDKLGSDLSAIPADRFETLAELEHMRWCRYHYLNNWTLGQPENGRAKDPVKRIHINLVPYSELSEGDKEKDRENLRVLSSL